MSGADDRPGALPPELLQVLREADAWLARRPPARALEQRILAAEPAPRGGWLLRFAQIAVPVALLILYAFERSRREPTRANPGEAARTLRLGSGDVDVIHRAPQAPDPEPQTVTPIDSEYEDIDEPGPTPAIPTIEAPTAPSTSVTDEPAPTAPAPAIPTPPRGGPGVVPAAAPGQTSSPIATPQIGPPTSGGGTASPSPIGGGTDPSPAHNRPTPRPPPSPEAPRDEDPGGTVEVHVIGVYDSYAAASDREGEASLHIDRPGRHIVVLSAYAETRWTLTVGDDVEVVQLLAVGYEPQSIAAAPAGVMFDVMDASDDGGYLGCGYEYPDTELSGCETGEFLAQVESLLALPVTSFHGCYAASSFVLADDLGVTSDCWTDAGYALTGFP